MDRIRVYYYLAKPGLVYGNSIALASGYALAVLYGASFDYTLFKALLGTSLVMASACVANNIYDRDIDAYMQRTKSRALVKHDIRLLPAAIYGAVLLMIGSAILLSISSIVAILGLFGWVSYAFVYTYAKRLTYHATLIGTIPGAIPPIIGYIAGGGSDIIVLAGILLLMVGWQMVHFYAIAIRRESDYSKASLPTVTRVIGMKATKQHMEWWSIITFVGVAILGFFNPFYGLGMAILGAWWLRAILYRNDNNIEWARYIFMRSLWFLLAWLVVTAISAFLSQIWA